MSVLALCILPRGKFLMNLLLNLIMVALGTALSMLALWSAVQARLHTTVPSTDGSPPPAYNPSQSAVCAVWLFFNIWLANVIRAKLPAFNLPVITYSILANISATFGPFMTSTAAAEAFIRELLVAILVAFAIALCVNLVAIPVSSRLVVFHEFAAAIRLLQKTVALQKEYLASLERDDMFALATRTETGGCGGPAWTRGRRKEQRRLTKEQRAADKLRKIEASAREVAGKLHADMPFAKRDVAWGKLDARDLGEMFALLRNVFTPV